MLGKIIDIIAAIYIMFLLPVCWISAEQEILQERAFAVAMDRLMDSIQCQGYVGEQHYVKLSELSTKLEKAGIQLWYYPEVKRDEGILLNAEYIAAAQQSYQAGEVYKLSSGAVMLWKAEGAKGLVRIRSGLKNRSVVSKKEAL